MRNLLSLLICLLLTACASAPKYTVDDGRPVNETLLGNIRAFGAGEQAVRPAIARSAALKDPDCDKQWELPFALATSNGWAENDRVAWVRALNVDERLTVVAVAPGSPLQLGDKVVVLASLRTEDTEQMLNGLAEIRDRGQPFSVVLSTGKQHVITPFEVCRGYTRFAPPSTPEVQDYHWLLSMHSLEVPKVQLTEDEALWAVLWTQGLSEEGGARMKTFHYGSKIVGTLYNLVTLASGLKGAAMAAEAAVTAAKNAAQNVVTEVLKQQLIEQGKSLAAQKLREGLTDAAEKLTRQQVVNALQAAAANRGSLSGVARVGATVFDRADAWAFERVAKLGGNPLGGFRLHQKLIENSFTSNAFAFDAERLDALSKLADAKGLGYEVQAILNGFKPEELLFEIGAMPLASAPAAFSFSGPEDMNQGRFARGLIDAMLDMPMASGPAKK
ncbi:hypothetical protein [Kinneretia aquatilis]|uniref:hypothetical protein n=1 Tax=Kinneretia aquatilis TaxID=2070761 RepID=UPI0013FE29D5|nr:hypothetical protein [Paucibacter aquatile]